MSFIVLLITRRPPDFPLGRAMESKQVLALGILWWIFLQWLSLSPSTPWGFLTPALSALRLAVRPVAEAEGADMLKQEHNREDW